MAPLDPSVAEIAGASAALTQATRMAERVAALEARTGTEIAALKQDTAAIRTMFHDANNKMQVLIGAEERFSITLQGLEARFGTQTEQMKKLVTAVEDLVIARTKAEGAWWIVGKICLIVGVIGSAIATATTLGWWALSHLAIKP